MDPEVPTANGQVPHDEACSTAAHVDMQFSVDSQLQAPDKELARLTSVTFVRVGNESRF